MVDFTRVLTENPNGVLATQDGKKVKTRIFQYLFSQDNKVYFCTSNQKLVYKQLKDNPYASFCTFTSDFCPVLSINGRVIFVDDISLKEKALNDNPSINGIYKSADNPIFELFYINIEEIETFSFADGPNTYYL